MLEQLQTSATMHTQIAEEFREIAEHFDRLKTRFVEMAEVALGVGHQINALSMSMDESGIAPVEQWPQIGETVEIGFVARGDQLILRAVVEIPCHEKTSESAENDFLALHPRAEGVRTTLADYPDIPPLCYDWSKVEWPPIPVGSRVRLDHGEFYTKTGTVTEDVGPHCKIVVGGKLTALGKRWLTVLETPPVEFTRTFDQLGGFGFDHGPEPVIPEMAVHVPSTVPPPVETNEIGAIVHSAEFAPDHEPPSAELPAAKPKRAKTEYTAQEWADSMHFLSFMKKQPFNTWTAERQNAKRDEFVASVPEGEKMNRWGQRFAKFCGVSA